MTNAEMNRRLATLTHEQFVNVKWHIEQGFGAQSIVIETDLTLKQVNAVVQKLQGPNTPKRRVQA